MLKTVPFANAVSLTTAVFYFFLFLLYILLPGIFSLLYNSKFMGANMARNMPPTSEPISAVVSLATVTIAAWAGGYLLANLYNRFVKER